WSGISNVLFWSPLAVDVADLPITLDFAAPWPNPAHSLVHCSYALPTASELEVDVYDASGRSVAALARGMRPAGRGAVEWDLRDHAGRQVPPGIYLVHARLAGRSWTRRLTVVR